MFRKKLMIYFFSLGLLCSANWLSAQPQAETLPKSVKVIFYTPSDRALMSTISYDIWQDVATTLHIQFTTLKASNKQDALQWLAQGKGDILIGPLHYTDAPGSDYMNNYLTIETGVIINSNTQVQYSDKVFAILNIIFSKAVLGLLILLILGSILTWFIERRHADSPFHGEVKKSLWRAFWFQATTFTTVAYGDTIPTSVLGRSFTLIMQYISVFLLAAFTASITAELTSLQMHTKQLSSLAQLYDKKVAYLVDEPLVAGNISRYYATPVPCTSVDMLVEKVANNQVEAAFADRLELRHYLKLHPESKVLLTRFAIPQGNYVFIIQKNHALATPITMALYQLKANGVISKMIDSYVGADDAATMGA